MRGHFGIGIYHPKTKGNIGTLLRSAQAFGADYVFTIGKRYQRDITDTTAAPRHIPVWNFPTFEAFKEAMPMHSRIIAVEYPGDHRLSNFVHPQQATYLLGAEDNGLPPDVIEQCHGTLVVDGGEFCLNVATAGSIVLWDRISKAVRVGGAQ